MKSSCAATGIPVGNCQRRRLIRNGMPRAARPAALLPDRGRSRASASAPHDARASAARRGSTATVPRQPSGTGPGWRQAGNVRCQRSNAAQQLRRKGRERRLRPRLPFPRRRTAHKPASADRPYRRLRHRNARPDSRCPICRCERPVAGSHLPAPGARGCRHIVRAAHRAALPVLERPLQRRYLYPARKIGRRRVRPAPAQQRRLPTPRR